MATKAAIGVILGGTFVISFFISTALFDTLAKANGFYDEGAAERVWAAE